jgi:hypothetical protein
MRRILTAAATAVVLGAATLVGGQLAAPTTASAAVSCEYPVWGPSNYSVTQVCNFVDGYEKYYLSADCADGQRWTGPKVYVHHQAWVGCGNGAGPILRYYIHAST